MKRLNLKQAKEILLNHTKKHEKWFKHSLKTYEIASKIANILQEKGISFDKNLATISALLHDIGRSISHGYLHGWEGYSLLKKLGYPQYGKSCISHWLKGRSKSEILKESQIPEEFIDGIAKEVDIFKFTLEEKIVALSDSLSLSDKVSSIEERFKEAKKRYGDSAWIRKNEEISHSIKEEIDKLVGFCIYKAFEKTR